LCLAKGLASGQARPARLIQRFGSAANLNIHLHCLVLDGVYRCDADGKPTFVEVGSPTDEEVHALLQTLIARLMKMLTRRGVLVQDMGQTWLAEPGRWSSSSRRRGATALQMKIIAAIVERQVSRL
jgi:hypothetical protein